MTFKKKLHPNLDDLHCGVRGGVADVLGDLLSLRLVGDFALEPPQGTELAEGENVPEDLDLHFVFHRGYSLEESRVGVKNFCTVIFRTSFVPIAQKSHLARFMLVQSGDSLRKSLILRDLHRPPPPYPPA